MSGVVVHRLVKVIWFPAPLKATASMYARIRSRPRPVSLEWSVSFDSAPCAYRPAAPVTVVTESLSQKWEGEAPAEPNPW
jgi:hypothetical protein